jgi:hypothetical protein
VKGHVNKRAEKTLASVFRVFGFWDRGTRVPCNRNPKIAKCEVPFSLDRGHHRWLREEKA